MGRYDHLDIFMKMLEVLEKDLELNPRKLSTQEHTKVTNIIERLEGNLIVQSVEEEITMEGDKFENISSSVIATRGSIARGIITVRERRGADVADALSQLDNALSSSDLPDKTKQEALELLKEITNQAGSKQASKSVLKTLGNSLGKMIENVGSVASVFEKVWPVIKSLWA
jgi:hypothetical protein